MIEQRECRHCGRAFMAYRTDHYFCSHRCWGQVYRTTPTYKARSAARSAAIWAQQKAKKRAARFCLCCSAPIPETLKVTAKFCSNTCAHRSRNEKISLAIWAKVNPIAECRECGKSFKRYQPRTVLVFCSSKCRERFHNRRPPKPKHILICAGCGGTFLSYHLKFRKFCSFQCRKTSWPLYAYRYRTTHPKAVVRSAQKKNYQKEYQQVWRQERKIKLDALRLILGQKNITPDPPLWFWAHYPQGLVKHRYQQSLQIAHHTFRNIMKGN